MTDQHADKAALWTLISRQLSTAKTFAEDLNSLFALMAKATLATGALLLVGYCLATQVIPHGLTFGDTATLLSVAMAFGLLQLIATAMCTYSVLWLVALLCAMSRGSRRLQYALGSRSKLDVTTIEPPADALPRLKGSLSSWPILASSLVAFAIVGANLLAYPVGSSSSGRRLALFLMVFTVTGFGLAVVLLTKRSTKEERPIKAAIAVFLLVMAPAVAMPDVLFDVTMSIAGIRQHRKAVLVSSANLSRLQAAAASVGRSLNVCASAHGEERTVLDLDLVWHGIGDTTYAKLTVDEGSWNHPPHYIVVELDSDGVSLLRSNLKIGCGAADVSEPLRPAATRARQLITP